MTFVFITLITPISLCIKNKTANVINWLFSDFSKKFHLTVPLDRWEKLEGEPALVTVISSRTGSEIFIEEIWTRDHNHTAAEEAGFSFWFRY